jgi:hypothetical protein
MKICATIAAFFILGAACAVAQSTAPSAEVKPAVPQDAAPASTVTQAKIDPAKEADIRRLLEVSGTKAIMTDTMASLLKSMRPLLENALPPGDYRGKLIDLFYVKFQSKLDLNRFLDLAMVSYDRYFSDEEIKSLIVFYQTPAGKKTVSVMPKIINEMREGGQKLGEPLGRDAMQEVLAEHPELLEAMQAAAKNR